MLLKAGYVEIGMDHFALPTDSLAKAAETGDLHRNFMGYTAQRTDVLLGMGVSAISEAPGCFHQNEKVLRVYERRAGGGEIPTLRGHILTATDRKHREQILQLMTGFSLEVTDEAQFQEVREALAPLASDGLIEWEGRRLRIPQRGRPFLRNICMALDKHYWRRQPEGKLFSQVV